VLDSGHACKSSHGAILLEGLDRVQSTWLLSEFPVVEQLTVVQLAPLLDELGSGPRQVATQMVPLSIRTSASCSAQTA